MKNILLSVVLLIIQLGTDSLYAFDQSPENKLRTVRLGVMTKTDVESILGKPFGAEPTRWTYNIATPAERSFPFLSGRSLATPTTGLITVRFNESGLVNGLELARYSEVPFKNEY